MSGAAKRQSVRIREERDDLNLIVESIDDDSNRRFPVADNGIGIDEKYYKKIFQIFQTLKLRDGVESKGARLTIVWKIVKMHGGMTWGIESDYREVNNHENDM